MLVPCGSADGVQQHQRLLVRHIGRVGLVVVRDRAVRLLVLAITPHVAARDSVQSTKTNK